MLVAWAGAPLPGLCRAARDLGWSGLEGLVGVPGHLGGGVTMNAGGRWGELWDVIESVRVLEPNGEPRDLERAACTPRSARCCASSAARGSRSRSAWRSTCARSPPPSR